MRAKLFGIYFETSFLCVAIMSAVLILDESNRVLFCFVSALIHECGHLFAMYCFSIKPDRIKLRLFDIVINADTDKSLMADFLITVSGPLFNFIAAFFFYFFSKTLFVINLVLGVFNLLPIDTFDGGHALSLLLCVKFSYKTVRGTIKALTFVLLVPIFIFGVLLLFYSKYNYSLLLIALYMVAVLFLK